MNQNRMRDDDMPTQSSNMEPAEGSRETVRDSGDDLGSSSDRAMFDERMRSGEPAQSTDRCGSEGERGMGSSRERGGTDAGGITNRPLDREGCEQDQLPERGHSKSER